MSERTWAQKFGQYLMNIKLLITVLPLLGFSIGFFQHDNIKKASQPEPIIEPIAPKVEAPKVEHSTSKRVETVVKTKDYDLVIKELLKTTKKQAREITGLKHEAAQQQEQIDAVKKWIGFND